MDESGTSTAASPQALKGRGALTNLDGRYENLRGEAVEDDWPGDGEAPPPLKTVVSNDTSRKVIARNDSPDIPFDRSINPYRGCEHGCIYCFARPTHAWLGLSPGLDFESRLFAKKDAALCLRRELARPGYRPRPIAFGTNTDPYQPIERGLKITRQLLEVLAEAGHPVTMVTKSPLVLRDLDILAEMAGRRLARVALSVTTLDAALARRMEPRAPSARKRLAAIEDLAKAGVPVGVMAAPMIPALNDGELEAILEAAKGAGADQASYILLRLPLEIKELFEDWLKAHYPDRKSRVLKLMREARGGALYDATFGKRMRGEGPYAKLLADRFRLACKRLQLGGAARDAFASQLDLTQFRPPAADPRQMRLL